MAFISKTGSATRSASKLDSSASESNAACEACLTQPSPFFTQEKAVPAGGVDMTNDGAQARLLKSGVIAALVLPVIQRYEQHALFEI
jgi:hypothetical protein